MPSAMNGNRTVQAPSPDVGSAPAPLGQISLAGQSEVLKQVLGVIEKKVRNMEKKKVSRRPPPPCRLFHRPSHVFQRLL